MKLLRKIIRLEWLFLEEGSGTFHASVGNMEFSFFNSIVRYRERILQQALDCIQICKKNHTYTHSTKMLNSMSICLTENAQKRIRIPPFVPDESRPKFACCWPRAQLVLEGSVAYSEGLFSCGGEKTGDAGGQNLGEWRGQSC